MTWREAFRDAAFSAIDWLTKPPRGCARAEPTGVEQERTNADAKGRGAAAQPTAPADPVGYKEFAWGESVKEVRLKVPDLTAESLSVFGAPQTAMVFFHSADFNDHVPDPLSSTNAGSLSGYASESKDLKFWFLSGKLAGVTVEFSKENAFAALCQKYGSVRSITIRHIAYTYQAAAWDRGPNRLIVWERPYWAGPDSEMIDLESVTYIDGRWFGEVRKQMLDRRRGELAAQNSRID